MLKILSRKINSYMSMGISKLLFYNKKITKDKGILNINKKVSYVAYPNTMLAVTFNASKIGMVSS